MTKSIITRDDFEGGIVTYDGIANIVCKRTVELGIELEIFLPLNDAGTTFFSERFCKYLDQQIETKYTGMQFFNSENMERLIRRYLTPVQLQSVYDFDILMLVGWAQIIHADTQEWLDKEETQERIRKEENLSRYHND